jgi:hypothetical protein
MNNYLWCHFVENSKVGNGIKSDRSLMLIAYSGYKTQECKRYPEKEIIFQVRLNTL